MFENLSERLEKSFKLLKGQGRISDINIAETLKEVRRALLDADVNFKIAKQFTDTVKQKAIGQEVLKAVNPSQMMVKIVHDELVELMGVDKVDINIKINPAIILIAGLQGSGKTTFSGKLEKILCWWHVTSTDRQLSNSLRLLEARLKFLFIWRRAT
jgi:signal recognition particle subunit SRP54